MAAGTVRRPKVSSKKIVVSKFTSVAPVGEFRDDGDF